MKTKISAPVMWISLPPHPRHKSKGMRSKQIILCTLMILVSCAAVYILSSSLIASDANQKGPNQSNDLQALNPSPQPP